MILVNVTFVCILSIISQIPLLRKSFNLALTRCKTCKSACKSSKYNLSKKVGARLTISEGLDIWLPDAKHLDPHPRSLVPPSTAPRSDVSTQAAPYIDVPAQAQSIIWDCANSRGSTPRQFFPNSKVTVTANSEPMPEPSGTNIAAGSCNLSDHDSASPSSDCGSSSLFSDHAIHNRNKRRKVSKRRTSDSDSDSLHGKSPKALKAQVFTHSAICITSITNFGFSVYIFSSYERSLQHPGIRWLNYRKILKFRKRKRTPCIPISWLWIFDLSRRGLFLSRRCPNSWWFCRLPRLIYRDSGALQFRRHNNQGTFRPNFHTPQVGALIETSS